MVLIKTSGSFRTELKRQLRYAIAAAVGFMIAFSWRETIIASTREILERMTNAGGNIINVYNSFFITIIGVLIILVSSKLLKE